MKPAAGSAIIPGLRPNWAGQLLLPFANGRNGGIVGVDDLAVGQRLALRQPAGLVCDPVMGLERGRELGVQTRPLLLRQLRRAVQALPGRPAPAAGPAVPAPTIASRSGAPVSQTPSPSLGTGDRSGASRCWRSCWSCCACACSAVPLGGALARLWT